MREPHTTSVACLADRLVHDVQTGPMPRALLLTPPAPEVYGYFTHTLVPQAASTIFGLSADNRTGHGTPGRSPFRSLVTRCFRQSVSSGTCAPQGIDPPPRPLGIHYLRQVGHLFSSTMPLRSVRSLSFSELMSSCTHKAAVSIMVKRVTNNSAEEGERTDRSSRVTE